MDRYQVGDRVVVHGYRNRLQATAIGTVTDNVDRWGDGHYLVDVPGSLRNNFFVNWAAYGEVDDILDVPEDMLDAFPAARLAALVKKGRR